MVRKLLAACAIIASLLVITGHGQTGTVMPSPYQTVFDSNGNPINAAKVCTYTAGTTTPVSTFTDVTLGVANANPIRTDSAGRFVAFLTPGVSYKFVYQDSSGTTGTCDGVTFRTVDNVLAVPGSSSSVDTIGIAASTLTAREAVYLSDGSGGLIAGSWYPASSALAYSSTLPVIGMTTNAIVAGATGAIRISGQMPNMTALTVGADYFLSTGGTITTTAPTLSRYIGRADSTTTLELVPNPRATTFADTSLVCGRLTLTTAVPVTIADVTAATTLYYSPIQGCNQITLYNGSLNVTDTLPEISIAVPATTSQMYDVFVLDTAGVPSLELLAWTNDTTRATAVSLQNGFLSKAATPTRRYVGSFRTTTVSGQTEDSIAKRYVWNYYNRVPRSLRVLEATDSWMYTTATIRQANGAATNQLDVVVGIAEIVLDAHVRVWVVNSGGAVVSVGIGEDSTTVYKVGALLVSAVTAPASGTIVSADLLVSPAVGRHIYTWLEYSTAAGGSTWYGDNGSTFLQSGIFGTIPG